MTPDSEGQPFSESYLSSPEYRERLMRKLNTLIAVLEVAAAKVRRSIDGPGADVEKLSRIRKNLQDTLEVCVRARTALEHRGTLSAPLAADLSKVNPDLAQSARALHEAGALQKPRAAEKRQKAGKRAVRKQRDCTTAAEAERLARKPRIRPEDVRTCDLDLLAKQLQI